MFLILVGDFAIPALRDDSRGQSFASSGVVFRPLRWYAAPHEPDPSARCGSSPPAPNLPTALGACRRAFFAIALFSGMSNILMLTGALFMLEVYDRVLPSRSVPTLVALLILVAGLYAAQGVIDLIRSRILVRIGTASTRR